MRILVLGAGAIGGYFGGRLAESGADVTFLVRSARKAQLDTDGLVVKSAVGDIALRVRTLAAGETASPFDLVLLSCKSYDLESAIATIASYLGAGSAILPLLNGIRHLDRLGARFGAERVLGGACYISVALDNGVVRHRGELQALVFGEVSGAVGARTKAIEAAFAATRVKATLSTAILQAMWEKWVMLAALAAATTLARATVGEIMAAPSGEEFLLGALGECAAVATAEGHAPSAAALAQARTLLTQRGSGFAASMLHDLAAGGRTEADHVIGDLVERAHGHGLAVPILRVALANLEVHEARRQRG
ncbi:MAG TPA: ketopantoate reductase family protein [Stellaceae bacterium]|nr:ketopantoate reductase family protein [Stellaceae bacterium]